MFNNFVTRGIPANSVEPPDNASNVPGDTTAALAATGKTNAAHTEVSVKKSSETTEKESSGHDDLADEAPKEPSNESIVNGCGFIGRSSSAL